MVLKYYVRFDDNQNMVIFEEEIKEKPRRALDGLVKINTCIKN